MAMLSHHFRVLSKSVANSCIMIWERCTPSGVLREARKMAPCAISYLELTLFCVWDMAPFFLQESGWGQGDRLLRAPGDAGQFPSQPQRIQADPSKLCGGLPFGTIFLSYLVGQFQHLPCDRFRFGVFVRLALQHIPDRNQ